MASYEAWRARRDDLERLERSAGAALRAVPGIGSGRMGLTPDDVKARPDYRAAVADHRRAFEALREHNGNGARLFKREIAAERDARRASRT